MIKINKRKKIWYLLFAVVLSYCGFILYKIENRDYSKDILSNKKDYENELGEYVISSDEISLYNLNESNYEKIGMIGKNVILHLEKTLDKKYYKVLDLDKEYYVGNNDLSDYNDDVSYDDRYKEYIVFNKNVNTSDVTSFYDEDDNLVYEIYDDYSLPIIINDDDRYGVEFGKRLLYIKKKSSNIVNNVNTNLVNSSGIGVLNYHFFFEDDGECDEDICISKKQFESELDFLNGNNILSLKSNEVEMYIDGKIQLPKSVYITIDDGGKNLIGLKMLDEKKMYATVFLITSWYDPSSYFSSEYIELHSHGDDLHGSGICPGGQGGAIKCEDREKLLDDLLLSRNKLNGSTVFAYPFYEYNSYAIDILKEAGFTMAFIGESEESDNLVKVGMNKYTLPRFVMVNYTTIDDLTSYFELI